MTNHNKPAAWRFSTNAERAAGVRQITQFFQEQWMTATEWGVYITMCAYFWLSRSEPSEPAVRQVLSHVKTFGLVAVLVVPVITSMISTARWRSWSSVARLASQFLRILAWYLLALWLIGQRGDDLYKWALTHPNDAAIGAAALAIVCMVVHFGVRSIGWIEEHRQIVRPVAMVAGVVAKPTARDNRYTSAHEAGHALVYAALGDLPADVKLAVNDRPDEHGALGFVTGICSEHRLEEKSFAEWYMLAFLAGKFGEATRHGESTLGSSNDHLRWLGVARSYLANHYRGMYYAEPQNKFEQEQNEEKLEALQAEQLATLRTFFDLNSEVFKQLADTVLEMRTMGRDDLIPYLRQVELPDGFPLPYGPFETFAPEWRVATDSSIGHA